MAAPRRRRAAAATPGGPMRRGGGLSLPSKEQIEGQEGQAEAMVSVEMAYHHPVYGFQPDSFPLKGLEDIRRRFDQSSPVDEICIEREPAVCKTTCAQDANFHGYPSSIPPDFRHQGLGFELFHIPVQSRATDVGACPHHRFALPVLQGQMQDQGAWAVE
ncbi:MAG: hypothetical protein FD137_343 [Spirochaetes bacterium]|nr:MAG: hypothetical protein FD137_343 [Spirochaetota bacterium]